jgi:two-component system, NtrC family, sensor kinase
MQLRRRIALFLGTVAVLLGLLVGAGLEATVMPTFLNLERRYALADFERVTQAIERELEHLDILAQDWGVWDEAHDFLAGTNPGFIEANTYPSLGEELDLCLLQIHDRLGRLVWQKRWAPAEHQDRELIELPACDWPTDHPWLRGAEERQSLCGLLATTWGPVMISAQPVLRNNHAGEMLGTLLMVRALDHRAQAELVEETKVEYQLVALDNPVEHCNAPRSPDSAPLGAEPHLLVAADSLLVTADIKDGLDRPIYRLEVQSPRAIAAGGRRALAWAWALLFLVGLALILCLDQWLARSVVAPLRHFTQAALSVRTRAEAERLLDMDREDELGVLTRRFAAYLDEHQRFEQQLTTASHQAGMSEVATGVLHNVGNLLNGVTVSSALMRDRLAGLPVREFAALAERLGQDSPDLALQGRQADAMRKLIGLLAQRLEQTAGNALEECHNLNSRVNDVTGLVAAQQALARASGFDEDVDIDELLDVALRVALPPHSGLEVRRGVRRGCRFKGSRYKLLQILVNLLKNAVEAYPSPRPAAAWIAVRCTPLPEHLEICVSDGGQGIPAEQLTSIFQHGFTTKPEGHGFGLHSSAAAAIEMGGTLSAESPGRGGGARFVLLLPTGAPAAAAPDSPTQVAAA